MRGLGRWHAPARHDEFTPSGLLRTIGAEYRGKYPEAAGCKRMRLHIAAKYAAMGAEAKGLLLRQTPCWRVGSRCSFAFAHPPIRSISKLLKPRYAPPL